MKPCFSVVFEFKEEISIMASMGEMPDATR